MKELNKYKNKKPIMKNKTKQISFKKKKEENCYYATCVHHTKST